MDTSSSLPSVDRSGAVKGRLDELLLDAPRTEPPLPPLLLLGWDPDFMSRLRLRKALTAEPANTMSAPCVSSLLELCPLPFLSLFCGPSSLPSLFEGGRVTILPDANSVDFETKLLPPIGRLPLRPRPECSPLGWSVLLSPEEAPPPRRCCCCCC